jgi:hypothetical protein
MPCNPSSHLLAGKLSYITSIAACCCYCYLLAGNEPLAPGAVKLGTGSAAEAKAAAGNVCSQLVLLGGELSLQSMLGPRTAAVKNVAMNRTLAAGASVKKMGAADVGVGCLCMLFCFAAAAFSHACSAQAYTSTWVGELAVVCAQRCRWFPHVFCSALSRMCLTVQLCVQIDAQVCV